MIISGFTKSFRATCGDSHPTITLLFFLMETGVIPGTLFHWRVLFGSNEGRVFNKIVTCLGGRRLLQIFCICRGFQKESETLIKKIFVSFKRANDCVVIFCLCL